MRLKAAFLACAGAVLLLTGCVTVPSAGGSSGRSLKSVGKDVDSILLAANDTAPAAARDLLLARGFSNPADDGLKRRISSRTLFINDTAIYYVSSGKAVIADDSFDKKLKAEGKWTVRGQQVCHSVRQGHEFCTAVYVRGDEALCWPELGEDRGFLRRCAIYKGNGTKGPRPAVANLAKFRPGAAKARTSSGAGQGTIGSAELARLATGRTLKIGDSYLYYAPTGTVEIRDRTLGEPLASRGSWRVKADQLCHSVTAGHELCLTLSKQPDGSLICRPALGGGNDRGAFERPCGWALGNATRGVVPEMVVAAAMKLPSPQVGKQLSVWGYRPFASADLVRSLSGNTLVLGRSRMFLSGNGTVQIVDRTMADVLTSHGRWGVKGSELCLTNRPGHEFCTTVLFGNKSLICWPEDGEDKRRPDFLRECRLFAGNQAS